MLQTLGPLPPGPLNRILFITATRIGDAVLSTGLLAHLIERYPEARFTIVAGPAAAPLFASVPRLERLISLTKRSHSRHWLDLYAQTAATRWDLAIDLRGSLFSWLLWTKARRVMAKGDPTEHRVVQLARLFRLTEPPPPCLWPSEDDQRLAAQLVGEGPPVLGIGPSANWRGKQWHALRFAELASRLTAPGAILEGARIAVFAAPHERALAEPVLQSIPEGRRLDLIDAGSLNVVAACLARCRLFIGNDTGLMHMAAAAGTPVLGLFGPSPLAQYRPWGSHTAVAVTAIPYEALVTAPDFDHRRTDSLMDSLTVDAAEAAAVTLLRNTGSAS